MNLEGVSSYNDTRQLRHLFDTVETQVRGLKALGVSAESYGGLLSSVLLSKLPPEIRLIVSRGLSGDHWELDEILNLLEAELTAREMATAAQLKKPAFSRGPSVLRRVPPTASTLVASMSTSCVYCGQSHDSSSCSAVPIVEARKQSLRRSGRCYVCLRRNHISRNCRSSMKCSRCGGKHHNSICLQSAGGGREATARFPSEGENRPGSTTTPVMYVNSRTQVMLQTATVVVHRAGKCRPTCSARAVLDCGSQRTYVTSRVQQALSLPTASTEMVEIKTFGSTESLKQPCNLVTLGIITRNGRSLRINALVVPHICDAIHGQPPKVVMRQYPHLMDLDLADGGERVGMTIDLLIGADHYWSMVSGKVRRGETGPIALDTRVGWVLSGPIENNATEQSIVGFINTHALQVHTLPESTDVNEGLRRFWELESIGINPVEESVHSKFTQAIAFKNGRYEVSLPWRAGCKDLPENYDLCVKRLYGLQRRLQQDPSLCQAYDEVIREQLRNGIIEQVPESSEPLERVHYLPHHPVVRKDKATSRVRIVYDASSNAEGAGPSLNQCLHIGPSFGQSILNILVRFRIYRVPLVGDVEKAFLIVSVAQKDRDALRFLWFNDPLSPSPNLVKYRFTRVVFGVSSSPFLLNATIRHHMERYKEMDPTFVAKFLRGIYVDDLTSGASSEDACYEFYLKSKLRLSEAGFNLRKFMSSSLKLLRRITANEQQLTGELKQDPLLPKEYRVLGVLWNPSDDQLYFELKSVGEHLEKLDPTKRNVVGAAARIYDPLGILSPITISFKIFFQQLCRAKLNWDDLLTGELDRRWRILTSELSRVKSAVTPRFPPALNEVDHPQLQLVGFCDASQGAYAAVVYLRVSARDTSSVSILAAKTRVAPLKTITIPRLELLSALLLSRLIHSVECALRDEVDLELPICFTDSRITLCWIRHTEKEWKQFVENRVVEIRSLVPPSCWQHCPGVENPADMPSRGLTPVELEDRIEFWLQGPDWLKNPLSLEEEHGHPIPNECLEEMRNREDRSVSLLTASTPVDVTTVIDAKKFSTFRRLLKVMSQVFRFIRLLRHRHETRLSKEMSLRDVEAAHTFLVLVSQALLPADKRFELWNRRFGLVKDEKGVWRCRGRLSNANIPGETMFPIFLHKQDAITRLIVRDYHEKLKHSGVNSTLAELRTKYWVVGARPLVKQVVYSCVLCRRFQCKAYQGPSPPPLPSMRVKEDPPFSHTGIDFAGPLYTRETLSANPRKIWICLFTCLVTRAVHLDLVTEMKATAFIRCFKRFTARRGIPVTVLTDNGKTFKAADKLIASLVSHSSFKGHLLESGISWRFNVEKAPWWGGAFERMVQSTKRLLRKIIGASKLTYDELMTAVIEVESLLNSRPLTYISTDELVEPLTPSHLLCGRRISALPDTPSEEEDDYSPCVVTEADKLTRRMKHLGHTLEMFWIRWRNEYLLELRNSHRGSERRKDRVQTQVLVGDVVIVEDDKLPRGLWKLGAVTSLMIGKDGEVRAASVKTHSKDGKLMTLRRPVQKLYPLEIQEGPGAEFKPNDPQGRSSDTLTEASPSKSEIPIQNSRAKRTAALRAQERMAAWTRDLNAD